MGGGTCFDEKCSSKYLPGFFQQWERKIKTICCWFFKPESNRNVRNRSSDGPGSCEKTERAAANLDVHSPVSSALKVKCRASQSLSSVHEYQLQNNTPNPEKRCCHSNMSITADKALITKDFPKQSNSERNNWKEELWSFIFRNLPKLIFFKLYNNSVCLFDGAFFFNWMVFPLTDVCWEHLFICCIITSSKFSLGVDKWSQLAFILRCIRNVSECQHPTTSSGSMGLCPIYLPPFCHLETVA